VSRTYTCIGDVRGSCPHKHTTLVGAAMCLKRDVDGCRKQGGYSDRHVVPSEGRPLNEAEDDLVHAIVNDAEVT
jgi:hypothetical protein